MDFKRCKCNICLGKARKNQIVRVLCTDGDVRKAKIAQDKRTDARIKVDGQEVIGCVQVGETLGGHHIFWHYRSAGRGSRLLPSTFGDE